MNPINFTPGDGENISIAELKALTNLSSDWSREPDRKFYLPFDFYPVDNVHFHDPDLYPVMEVDAPHRFRTAQIHHISLSMPSSPPLYQNDILNPDIFCNESTLIDKDCVNEFCECVYTLEIPLGS